MRLRHWPVVPLLAWSVFGSAAAQDATYRIGAGGWVLEQFGSDVAVLRAPFTPDRMPDEAGLLLSCEGAERRLRLTFARPALPPGGDAAMLVRVRGGLPPTAGLATRIALSDGRTLTISEIGRSSPRGLLRFGEMLRTQPAGLDLLISPGPGPIALQRLMPYHLKLEYGARDATIIGHFVSACGRASAGQPG